MDPLLIPVASILAIAACAWGARRLLALPLCPICLGVGGTWLGMVLARAWGYPVDTSLLAVLMGGSVVGLASLIVKRLPAGRSPLAWKTLFIPAGLVAAYAVASQRWPLALGAVLALAVLAGLFLAAPRAPGPSRPVVDELARRMRDCC